MGKTFRFEKDFFDENKKGRGKKNYNKKKRMTENFKKFVQKQKAQRHDPFDDLPDNQKYDYREDDF